MSAIIKRVEDLTDEDIGIIENLRTCKVCGSRIVWGDFLGAFLHAGEEYVDHNVEIEGVATEEDA